MCDESLAVAAYAGALAALLRERAFAESACGELPIEIESAHVAALDDLWWKLTPDEQDRYDQALEAER